MTMTIKRGIVVADTGLGFVNMPAPVMVSVPLIKALNLRRYLLYWDTIEWVTVNPRNLSPNSEINILQQEGIFISTYFPIGVFEPTSIWSQIRYAQLEVFGDNNKKPNEIWSLDKTSIPSDLSSDYDSNQPGIELTLYNALPIVPIDVPVENIIKFKRRRNDELLRFRYAMERLFEEVINSPDFRRATYRSMDELNLALMDLHRVMSESFLKRLISSIKIELNITNILVGMAVGYGASIALNLPPEFVTLAGSALPAVKIDIGNITKPKYIPPNVRDYAYLYYVEKEASKKRRRRRK